MLNYSRCICNNLVYISVYTIREGFNIMNKFKKLITDVNVILACMLILLAISESPSLDSFKPLTLYIKLFSNIAITIITLYLCITVKEKPIGWVVRIISIIIFVTAFINSMLFTYRTFNEILNFW